MITTNEKYSIIILIIIIAVVGVIAYIVPSLFDGSQFALNNIEKNLPKVECNYSGDQKSYQAAVENADIGICSCISAEKLQKTCIDVTYDLALYEQAVNQANPDICNEIKEVERKEACINTSQSKVNYLGEENPQALADDYLFSHNEKAIEQLEKLTQEDSSNIDNLISLALVYAEKGLSEQEQGRSQTFFVEKAFAMVEQAKELDQNNSEVYRVEGYVYEIKPDIFEAIESYNKAIKLDPNNNSAYSGRGHANSMIGALERALDDFNIAAKLDTDNQNIHIYSNLCRLESSRDDLYQKAIKNCKIVIDSELSTPVFKSEAYQILATIFIKNGDYTQAGNYLLKAKSLTPQSANLFVTLANLYISQGDYIKAEESAGEAIGVAYTKADAHQTLAYSFYRQEKYQEAIQEAKIGLDLIQDDVSLLDPNKLIMYQDLYYTLANIYNKLGDEENEMRYKELGDSVLLTNLLNN